MSSCPKWPFLGPNAGPDAEDCYNHTFSIESRSLVTFTDLWFMLLLNLIETKNTLLIKFRSEGYGDGFGVRVEEGVKNRTNKRWTYPLQPPWEGGVRNCVCAIRGRRGLSGRGASCVARRLWRLSVRPWGRQTDARLAQATRPAHTISPPDLPK